MPQATTPDFIPAEETPDFIPAQAEQGSSPITSSSSMGPAPKENFWSRIENYTPQGRAEHPVLSRVGDVARSAGQLRDIVAPEVGLLGMAGIPGEEPAMPEMPGKSAAPSMGERAANMLRDPKGNIISLKPTKIAERVLDKIVPQRTDMATPAPKVPGRSSVFSAEAPTMAPANPRTGAPTPLETFTSRVPPKAPEPLRPFAGVTAPVRQAAIPRGPTLTPAQEFAARVPPPEEPGAPSLITLGNEPKPPQRPSEGSAARWRNEDVARLAKKGSKFGIEQMNQRGYEIPSEFNSQFIAGSAPKIDAAINNPREIGTFEGGAVNWRPQNEVQNQTPSLPRPRPTGPPPVPPRAPAMETPAEPIAPGSLPAAQSALADNPRYEKLSGTLKKAAAVNANRMPTFSALPVEQQAALRSAAQGMKSMPAIMRDAEMEELSKYGGKGDSILEKMAKRQADIEQNPPSDEPGSRETEGIGEQRRSQMERNPTQKSRDFKRMRTRYADRENER